MTSETPKLSIFQLRHRQGQRVTRPAVSLRGGSETGPGRRRKSSLDYRQQGANQVCEIRIARQDAHYKSKQNLSETAVQIHQIRTPLQF